ncbi:hypothetical protein [Kibdelosporangium phytohabitans]|uniref:Uncharacterized protein n=1 Tax=Kibdelosporangium phytohabitans TaxID=860235 RepID=A0A0N9I5D7_9PSEU|nr:hypothetical protein [Kibdelosporangium phytohabitans]ALG09613.1 hypothetical protein AOZ06_24335 [Kibdelosporangium phytohabitans]MBE1469048.1 hypothetical protein [Kibdelosporangium phytohabitans]
MGSDAARVLRKIAVRAFALAFLFGIFGQPLPAMALALAGFGLLFAPVTAPAAGRGDRVR